MGKRMRKISTNVHLFTTNLHLLAKKYIFPLYPKNIATARKKLSIHCAVFISLVFLTESHGFLNFFSSFLFPLHNLGEKQ